MANQDKKIVLVVDDEPDIRLFLRTVLEDAGFTVVTASDGDEALREVKKQKPDLISLDLIMPKKSGIPWKTRAPYSIRIVTVKSSFI